MDQSFPDLFDLKSISRVVDDAFNQIVGTYGRTLEAIFLPVLKLLNGLEKGLLALPWWVILLALAGLAWMSSRSWKTVVLVAALTFGLGVLGVWEAAMATIALMLISTLLAIDFTDPANTARFWYVSEEKLEPRLGERHEEPGADLEQPLCIARLVQALNTGLNGLDGTGSVAAFLMQHPEHRFALRRVQIMARRPFAEVRDNLIAADMLPIDLMRCKLAFFGASRFDPRSDKWVRISLFQDMPYPEDFNPRAAP